MDTTNSQTSPSEEDPRLVRAKVEVSALRKAGQPFDPVPWLTAQVAELQAPLREFLEGLDLPVPALTGGRTLPDTLPDFDRYEGLTFVGGGGMGAVYRATDTRLRRVVAVKVLHADLAARPDYVDRFLAEARVAAGLQHPNLNPVYDYGRHGPDDRPYFTMRLVEGARPGTTGRTLADVVGENLTAPNLAPWSALLTHFMAVCAGVAYAHQRGVLHRDLKPANVMVGAFDEVLVMDWGLTTVAGADGDTAHSLPVSAPHSAAGGVKGTVQFMSPEQARGEPVGLPTDVFALGGILAFILTGKPVYTGGAAFDVLKAARTCDTGPCLERVAAAGTPPALIDLIRACLSKDPLQRPASADDLAGSVREYLSRVEKELVETRVAVAAATAREAEQRTKRRWRYAATVAVAVLALAGVWYRYERANKRLALANAEREAANNIEWARYQEGLVHSIDALRHYLSPSRRSKERGIQKARAACGLFGQLVADFPHEPTHRVRLSETQLLLGGFLLREKQPDEGLVDLRRAALGFAALADEVSAAPPISRLNSQPETLTQEYLRRLSRECRITIAVAQLVRHQPFEAFVLLDAVARERSIQMPPLERGFDPLARQLRARKGVTDWVAQQVDPPVEGLEQPAEALLAQRDVALMALELESGRLPYSRGKTPDHARATREMAVLADAARVSDAAVYNSACAFALAAAEPGVGGELAERRAATAVGYLRRLSKAGYFLGKKQLAELGSDEDLIPLHGRQDFRVVVGDARRLWAVAGAVGGWRVLSGR